MIFKSVMQRPVCRLYLALCFVRRCGAHQAVFPVARFNVPEPPKGERAHVQYTNPCFPVENVRRAYSFVDMKMD